MWKIEACHKIIHYDTFDSCTVSRHAHPEKLKIVIFHVDDYKTIPPSQQHSNRSKQPDEGKDKMLNTGSGLSYREPSVRPQRSRNPS